jgi:imidazolonepropionase-like amidohydrolase
MRSKFFPLIALAVAVAACANDEPAAPPTVTVFDGATLIVGDESGPIADSVILVENGEFLAAGPRDEVTIPETVAATVDLTGQTVMPAIVDAHKHIASNREQMTEQLEHLAYYGVAAVISLGSDDGDLAFEVRGNPIPGAARLLTAGRGITAPEPGRSEVPHWVGTEEEAREAARTEAARGVDIIKIWVDDRNGQYDRLTPELYGAVIDEAHAQGVRVIAHIFSLEDAKGLVEAGLDAFAHGVRDQDIDDEFVTMVEARPDLVLVPNLPDRGVAVDLSWIDTLPPDAGANLQASSTDRPQAQETFGIQARNLDRLNDAGMTIAIGTDGNTAWAPHLEMEDMVASGMTPAEVIVAATRNAAEFLGLDDLGTIESGKNASFIVLDADPLADITNTREIVAVYLDGMELDRASLRASLSAGE